MGQAPSLIIETRGEHRCSAQRLRIGGYGPSLPEGIIFHGTGIASAGQDFFDRVPLEISPTTAKNSSVNNNRLAPPKDGRSQGQQGEEALFGLFKTRQKPAKSAAGAGGNGLQRRGRDEDRGGGVRAHNGASGRFVAGASPGKNAISELKIGNL